MAIDSAEWNGYNFTNTPDNANTTGLNDFQLHIREGLIVTFTIMGGAITIVFTVLTLVAVYDIV